MTRSYHQPAASPSPTRCSLSRMKADISDNMLLCTHKSVIFEDFFFKFYFFKLSSVFNHTIIITMYILLIHVGKFLYAFNPFTQGSHQSREQCVGTVPYSGVPQSRLSLLVFRRLNTRLSCLAVAEKLFSTHKQIFITVTIQEKINRLSIGTRDKKQSTKQKFPNVLCYIYIDTKTVFCTRL